MTFTVVANGVCIPCVSGECSLAVGEGGAHLVFARRRIGGAQQHENADAGYFLVTAASMFGLTPASVVVFDSRALMCDAPADEVVHTVLLEGPCLATVRFVPAQRVTDEVTCKALRVAVRHLTNEDAATTACAASHVANPTQQQPPRIGAVPVDELRAAVVRGIGDTRFAARFGDAVGTGWRRWLETCPEISAFTAKDDSSACVARRPSASAPPQDDTQQRAQPLQLPAGWEGEAAALLDSMRGSLSVAGIVSLGCAETFAWRRSAASFSTMMRYFQRARAHFCWSTNADHKTILQAATSSDDDQSGDDIDGEFRIANNAQRRETIAASGWG